MFSFWKIISLILVLILCIFLLLFPILSLRLLNCFILLFKSCSYILPIYPISNGYSVRPLFHCSKSMLFIISKFPIINVKIRFPF